MAQTPAQIVKTWNGQLKACGNPFRLRVTSQSPFIYLRGPFRQPPLVRSTGLRPADPEAWPTAYQLAQATHQRGGEPPNGLIGGRSSTPSRFSGWVMLVHATRKLLEIQGLRSTTAFNSHFNALSKRVDSPSPEAILHWIQEQDCGRRDYLSRCDTAIKFIEAGLPGLRREDVLNLRQRSRYRATSVADRMLAPDDAIVRWIDHLEDRPAWQWVFGMLATYGLRPHEVFHLEGPPDEDALVTVLPETKTGFHISHPAPEEWIERWRLRAMRLPSIRTDRPNNIIGQAVSTRCSRLAPPVSPDGRKLTPYDLRHCWARRVHCSPELIPLWTTADAAESLGHSESVHRRHYQRWITKAEQKLRARELRRKRLEEASTL